MDSEIECYKNFRLVHQLKRRIRIISPVLKKDIERCYILEILLKKRLEIKHVRFSSSLGSVVISFDFAQLPKKNLLILLDAVLANIAQKKYVRHKKKQKQFDGSVQEVDLAVMGMTCASCALLIEMVLNRDSDIKSTSVNFAIETVIVHGRLDKKQVADKIAVLGYETFEMDTLSQRKNLIVKEQQRIEKAKSRFLWSGALSTPVILVAMTMSQSRWSHWLQFLLTTLVVFGTGWQFFTKAWRLAKQKPPIWIP